MASLVGVWLSHPPLAIMLAISSSQRLAGSRGLLTDLFLSWGRNGLCQVLSRFNHVFSVVFRLRVVSPSCRKPLLLTKWSHLLPPDWLRARQRSPPTKYNLRIYFSLVLLTNYVFLFITAHTDNLVINVVQCSTMIMNLWNYIYMSISLKWNHFKWASCPLTAGIGSRNLLVPMCG